MKYYKDEVLKVYKSTTFEGIPYSDGEEIERQLLDSVSSVQDRSVFSIELANKITDWPSEYHFSSFRHAILRPLPIQPGDKVLELGCGCGAITRYLGELGANVTAVEGSLVRAQIAATRCEELENVRIIAEDITSLDLDDEFDWILLIGVLEYAPGFSNNLNPAAHYLDSLKKFCNRKTRLVVAIENKIGLKYFNYCSEDHLGIPFIGVQGLYQGTKVRTYGPLELKRILEESGFRYSHFLYPFPDYKLPRVILSQRGIDSDIFSPEQLLATMHSRDYSGNDARLFSEPLVMRELINNKSLSFLSNSLLVVSTMSARDLLEDDFLACTYSFERKIKYSTETCFHMNNSQIIVKKNRIAQSYEAPVKFKQYLLQQNLENIKYVNGNMAIWGLTELRAQNHTVSEIIERLAPWFELLQAQAHGEGIELRNYTLSGAFLDLTPSNVVISPDGAVAIDQEWVISGDIPLGWVILRSLVGSLAYLPGLETVPISVYDLFFCLCEHYKFQLFPEDVAEWADLEVAFQAEVRGERGLHQLAMSSSVFMPLHRLRKLQYEQEGVIESLREEIALLLASNADIDQELCEIRNKTSVLQHEIEVVKSEAEAAKSEAEAAKSEAEAAKSEAEAAKSEVEAAKSEVEVEKAKVRKLASELSRIQMSRSWRATAFLRRINAAWRN